MKNRGKARLVPDDIFTEEARRFLLKGEGTYKADGIIKELGYAKIKVKPMGKKCVDVWFYRCNDPYHCRFHHVEFGRTGGEMLMFPDLP